MSLAYLRSVIQSTLGEGKHLAAQEIVSFVLG